MEQTAEQEEDEEEVAPGRRADKWSRWSNTWLTRTVFIYFLFFLMQSSAGRGCGSWREDTSLGGATAGREDVLPAPLGSRR